MNKKTAGFGLAAVATLALGAYDRSNPSNSSSDFSVKAAIIIDTDGVDGKSLNQSVWEGLQAQDRENDLTKDTGCTYFQSDSESDYATNLDSAVSDGYSLILVIGYNFYDAIEETAPENKDVSYIIINDTVFDQDNAESVLFADDEGAYLAGITAVIQAKTKHVGFVGGVESDTVTRFEAGLKAGVASVDSSIKVDVQCVGSHSGSAKGKAIVAIMHAGGADAIYHAVGGFGTGIFSQAKEIDEKLTADSDQEVWVVGIDRDQSEEGDYTSSDNVNSNFVLTSTIREVGQVVQDISNEQLKSEELNGDTTKIYGLADGGADATTGSLSDNIKEVVEIAKQRAIDDEITVDDGLGD